jgi:predicted transposase YdaD
MLKRKWKMKDALAWRYKEGREERSEEIARNALMNGFSVDQIHIITGLDTDRIRNLQLNNA